MLLDTNAISAWAEQDAGILGIGLTVLLRTESGWRVQHLEARDSVLRLESLGLDLPLSAIYDRVF